MMAAGPRAGVEVTVPTDEELLLASGRGDGEAFTLLVQRYYRPIVHFVHRFLARADQVAAEDLAQQAFLSAWKYAPSFQPRAKASTWLFRIATNASLNYRRYERMRRPGVWGDRSGGAGRHDQSEGAELRLVETERSQQVRAAVAALPANQRAALVLRYFHEFTYAEIAEIMGLSTAAVDSLLHRARRTLHHRLSLKIGEDSPQIPSGPGA